MKKTDSNKTKHKTLSDIDIALIIITTFCFFIVVFIGYSCWRKRRPKRKHKASQRQIRKRRGQNENGRTESGQLLGDRSHSEDSLDFEDPGRQPFEEKSKKERKHSTQNSNNPSGIRSFLSRIMSSLPGRGNSPSTDAEASGNNDCNGASTSKQGRSSNNKEKLKKSRSYSPERRNKQNSESFADNKITKNDKQLVKVYQQKKNSKRSPTDQDPLGSSRTRSAHLTGISRDKGGEKSRKICVNKSNCTGLTCQKCDAYNDHGTHIDDVIGDDDHHGRSGAESKSVKNQQRGPAAECRKQFKDSGEDVHGRNPRGDGSLHATRQTNNEGISGESSRGSSHATGQANHDGMSGESSGRSKHATGQTNHKERSSRTGKDSGRMDYMTENERGKRSEIDSGRSHATPESRRPMHSGGSKSPTRQPTHQSATSRTIQESIWEKNYGGKTDSLGTRGVPDAGLNVIVIPEGYLLIESQSPGLNNDQGNRRRVEENIRRTTANTVECDDKMEVDYRKDERTNKQDQPTRPREEVFRGEPGIGGGRAIEEPKQEKRIESIGEMYNVMQYARREWKSDTLTAQTVRDGYFCIPQELGLRNLRVIRGDNYCAIRATLFQVLAKRIPFLDKLRNIEKILHELKDSRHDSIDDWAFASRIEVPRWNVYQEMETCLRELTKLVDLISGMDREEGRITQLLVNFNCKAFEIEIRLLEAIKFLMFYQATLLYRKMKANKDVPIFAVIMFARDSCADPWHFMTKHLNYVGDTGGLEQVEMHLLGYTLGVTIKVVRPSHFGQSDFIASYPEDMPDGTPVIALVAEDDRHYNILS